MIKIWDMLTFDLKGMLLPRYDWGYEQHFVNEFSRFLPVFTWGWNREWTPRRSRAISPRQKWVCDPENGQEKDVYLTETPMKQTVVKQDIHFYSAELRKEFPKLFWAAKYTLKQHVHCSTTATQKIKAYRLVGLLSLFFFHTVCIRDQNLLWMIK